MGQVGYIKTGRLIICYLYLPRFYYSIILSILNILLGVSINYNITITTKNTQCYTAILEMEYHETQISIAVYDIVKVNILISFRFS